MPLDPESAIQKVLRQRGEVTNRDVVRLTGLSRQAVHVHLRSLVEKGRLRAEGEGRATRYLPVQPGSAAGSLVLRKPIAGLEEDRVWNEVEERLPGLEKLPNAARHALHYAFTEMVNNAIDHSTSPSLEVRFSLRPDRVTFDVTDEGVGVFSKIQKEKALPSAIEAIQELSKGKLTTMPARHTGEGIFFTSKIAHVFTLESGDLQWLVDNERQDTGIFRVQARHGTRVRVELAPDRAGRLEDLFAQYTQGLAFTRTRTYVKLFEYGARFVSRSEAKRLLHNLEGFSEAILDFQGVEGIGQGFADEVFRVWTAAHPTTVLRPVNMNEPVAFMVQRARAAPTGS